MDEYTRWDDVPENLKTKTQLGKMGLRLARGQKPVAQFKSYYHGKSRPNWYDLYDSNAAQAKRQASPEQKERLRLGREKSQALRRCKYCGIKDRWPRKTQYICETCQDHQEMVAWARDVLTDDKAIILDTETTDLEGEIIEIAIINTAGAALFDAYVKPLGDISPEAQAVHGITAEKLASARPWPEHHAKVAGLIAGASRVIIYNADFDTDRMHQTAGQYGLELDLGRVECAMRRYANWVGQWSSYWGGYRWWPLDGGHTAMSDCLTALERIKEMAEETEHEPS